MKRLTTVLLTSCLSISPLSAELEKDIPLGIEVVTGIRSNYVYRGFNLGDALMDFQVETEVVIGESLALGAGGWLASEIGEDFTEGAGFLDLHHSLHEDFTVTTSASYHAHNDDFLNSGLDFGSSLSWHLTANWSISMGVSKDLAAHGWYVNLGSDWSFRLSDKTYLALSTGISAIEDYYRLSGLNDFHGQVSLTCNLNSMLSITPFAGWSCELDVGDGDEVYAGLWFEVSF